MAVVFGGKNREDFNIYGPLEGFYEKGGMLFREESFLSLLEKDEG